jgi:hypothetical protein
MQIKKIIAAKCVIEKEADKNANKIANENFIREIKSILGSKVSISHRK